MEVSINLGGMNFFDLFLSLPKAKTDPPNLETRKERHLGIIHDFPFFGHNPWPE